MGLFKLLTLPAWGPVAGTRWLLETLLREAEREFYDVEAIRRDLDALEAARAGGEIDAAEYERREEALLERLLEARAQQRERQRPGG